MYLLDVQFEWNTETPAAILKFQIQTPQGKKQFQQYWQEFSSPLRCQRCGVHVLPLTPLKGVCSQLGLYSSHMNQSPFYALNFYSSTVAERILPSSLLTWSVHPCYFPTSKPKTPHKMYCLYWYSRVASQVGNETLLQRSTNGLQ